MKITTDELRRATSALFDYLDRTDQREFEINDDFYWVIAEEERYAPYAQPKTFLMGQLSDDLGEVKRIADGSGTPVGRALVWLAAVLRRLGKSRVREHCHLVRFPTEHSDSLSGR